MENQIKKIIDYPVNKYKGWGYKNTFFLFISLGVLFYFADTDFVKNIINSIGSFGYIGAFISGIFFVSTFTVAPAIVVLCNLTNQLNLFGVAILAGLGAVIGDYLIFRFFKDKVSEELKPLFLKSKIPYLKKIFKTPYSIWLTPLVGAVIIASPLPDEIGVGILGITKLKSWQFAILSFFLNTAGIFIIATIARSF